MGQASAKTKAKYGPPVFDRTYPAFRHVIEVVPGFFHVRTDFTVAGVVNISTHMSVARLSNGNYVAIDAVKLCPDAKRELDELTSNGALLTAFIGTHPYHTLAIPAFHSHYPASETRRYYGCPRHLKNIRTDDRGTPINWFGDLGDECVRRSMEPELYMDIPAGSEFVNPLPPTTNHFSNVFVFHPASKTVFNDDTVLFSNNPGVLMRLFGMRDQTMTFHRSLSGPGLYPTEEAPKAFQTWVEKILNDWDFENIVTAHNGNCFTHAKVLLRELLDNTKPELRRLAVKYRNNRTHDETASWSKDPKETECG